MAIRIHKRIQVNIPVKNDEMFECLKNVNDTIFPILWLDEGADIDQENIDKLKSMVIIPLKVLEGVKWAMIVVGVLIFALGGVKVCVS